MDDTSETSPRGDVFPGGYGRTALVVGPRVPRLVRGTGTRVLTSDGDWLLDANMNFAVLVLGHAHPRVTRAAGEALRNGSCFGLAHDGEERLARKLVARIAHAEQVKFTNSGTEAVMFALRLARASTGRDTIIGVEGSYHGSSEVALAIGKGTAARGIAAGVRDAVRSIPLNDVRALERAVAASGDDLAAIIIDLLPNYAGLRPVSAEFARAAREACDRTGALLVFDEVISFRLTPGGLQRSYGVVPDITTLGKAIGGGLPIGAVLGSTAVMEPFNPFSSAPTDGSGTFNGNPVSVAAGLACLESFGPDEIEHANGLGDRLRGLVEQRIGDGWAVRGQGSLARVLRPGAPAEESRRFWWACYERGALVMPTGMMALPASMTTSDVDELADILVDASHS